ADPLRARPALELGQPRGRLVAGRLHARDLRGEPARVELDERRARLDPVAFPHVDRDDRLIALGDQLEPVPLERADGGDRGGSAAEAGGGEGETQKSDATADHFAALGRAPSRKRRVAWATSRSANSPSSS